MQECSVFKFEFQKQLNDASKYKAGPTAAREVCFADLALQLISGTNDGAIVDILRQRPECEG